MVNDAIRAAAVLPWYREEKIIRDLIREFEADQKRQEMIDGQRYYNNEGDITTRVIYFWDRNKEKQVDVTKPNNKIAHAFMKLLVDEKIGYFLGSSPNIAAENGQMQEKLITIFDESFDDVLNDVGVEASNKGIAWLYVYLGQAEPGEKPPLLFELIPSEQVIPIWEDRAHRMLAGLVNYYYMTDYDLETGQQNDVLKVECWHPDGVLFYTEYDGKLVEDIRAMFPDMQEREIPEAGLPHFVINGKGQSWGMVPFVPFRNNSQELNDLRFVRGLLDAYDIGVSDLSNTLEELRKLVLVLKNYQGTDLQVFMDNLRYFGAVKVDEDGGVDKLDLTFNSEGTTSYLDRLKKDIYQFGQGVNMDTDKFGQNPSGVALEFLYSGLKLKTDSLERKFKAAFVKMFQIACTYLAAIGEGSFDWRIAKVTFNRSIVSNVMENIEAVATSMGMISNKTSISHHPWVDDIDQELEQIEADDKLKLDRIPMGAADDEADDDEANNEDGDEADSPESGGGDA